jgi:hypothetical protein
MARKTKRAASSDTSFPGEWLLYFLVSRRERGQVSINLRCDYGEALLKFDPVVAHITSYGQVLNCVGPRIRRLLLSVGAAIAVVKWLLCVAKLVLVIFGS